MSSPLQPLSRFDLNPKSLLHVGANAGQEIADYRAGGVTRALLIEPLEAAFATLSMRAAEVPGFRAVKALCSDVDGETVTFHVASNNGESSSLLPPKHHLQSHPSVTFARNEEMATVRLDTLTDRIALDDAAHATGFDVLVLDVQGAELKVLQGGTKTLQRVGAVWCEVSHVEMYNGNARFLDVLLFLDLFGFKCVYFKANRKFYGDALFIKT